MISTHAVAAVVRAVDAAVVLLEQHLGAVGMQASLWTHWPVSGRASGRKSARTPWFWATQRRAAVAGVERAHGRDADPHPVRVGRVGHDGMEDEAAVAGLPPRADGCAPQARDVRPGDAAVVAPEQARGLDARVERAVGGRDVPDRVDRRLVVAVA